MTFLDSAVWAGKFLSDGWEDSPRERPVVDTRAGIDPLAGPGQAVDMVGAVAGAEHHRPPGAIVEPQLALRLIGGWGAAGRAAEAKIDIADIRVGGQRGRRCDLAKQRQC